MAFKDFAFKPPIHAIRVKSCGNDWVTDCDAMSMGVYIKGMEMPTSCMLCPLCVEEADPANGEMCMVTGTLMPPCTRERLDNCPLIPVTPHGRLIDADKQDAQIEALIERHLHGYTKSTWDFVCELRDILKRNLTIIPAEEGEK